MLPSLGSFSWRRIPARADLAFPARRTIGTLVPEQASIWMLKLRRGAVAKRYADLVESLYDAEEED